jgi:hypothetical protein
MSKVTCDYDCAYLYEGYCISIGGCVENEEGQIPESLLLKEEILRKY